MRTMTRKTNRYPATCIDCGGRVAAEGGWLAKAANGSWAAQHIGGCPDYSTTREYTEAIQRAEREDDERAYRAKADRDAAALNTPAEVGFYVKDGEAFRVVANKAGTSTYAKRFTVTRDWDGSARASWEYAPGVGRSLAAEGLVPMTAADAARIGLSHNICINCCRTLGGQTLSAHVSALIGYGEICATNNGWPYPKGAAAQRAFIASR